MNPDKGQFSDKKYWSESKRPEHWVVSRWNDEVNREKGTREMAGMSVKDLTDYNAMAEEKGQHGGFEVSGDALARLKAGKPAKTNWDVKRD